MDVFRKIHGAGNDFILLTGNGAHPPDGGWPDASIRLCERRKGIGADGLVVSTLIQHDPLVLEVSCYNSDGSMATMCGNALRCAAWTAAHDLGETRMTLVMAGVKHQAVVRVDDVAVTADLNRLDMRLFQAAWGGRALWFDYAHTGTEHAVAFVNNVDDVDAETCGRLVRHHEALTSVGGANVNFVQVLPGDELRIRTYERGVEAETLSCGSGSVAATAVARVRGLVANGTTVTVHNRSGTALTVQPTDIPGDSYWVSGPVSYVFRGELA